MPAPVRQQGFTLVELIVAIVVMALISVGTVRFITDSANGYSLTATRNQLSAAGRVVIDRISMELHNALPESVRVSAINADGVNGNQCIEFIPVRAATTYIDPAFRPANFKTSFTIVNLAPNALTTTIPTTYPIPNLYAVVYPTSSAELYTVNFTNNSTAAIALVKLVDDADSVNKDRLITHIVGNPNTTYTHRFLRQSSVERLFLTDSPVSFCVVGTKLYRYANYGFTSVQRTPGTGLPSVTPNRVLITDAINNSALTGVAGQAFTYSGASRRRNGVVQLELNFSQDGQQVRLDHEVLQQTAP